MLQRFEELTKVLSLEIHDPVQIDIKMFQGFEFYEVDFKLANQRNLIDQIVFLLGEDQ